MELLFVNEEITLTLNADLSLEELGNDMRGRGFSDVEVKIVSHEEYVETYALENQMSFSDADKLVMEGLKNHANDMNTLNPGITTFAAAAVNYSGSALGVRYNYYMYVTTSGSFRWYSGTGAIWVSSGSAEIILWDKVTCWLRIPGTNQILDKRRLY